MYKRIILLLLISSLLSVGFAQKNKRKSNARAPKNTYFEMLVNGSKDLNSFYCPEKKITFDFSVLDTNIKIIKYCWYNRLKSINLCGTSPIEISFPIIAPYPYTNTYPVELYIEYNTPGSTTSLFDTIISVINIDHVRVIMDTTVCQGKNITVPTLHGDTTFFNVQSDKFTTDKLGVSASGCDSLLTWHIEMIPYTRDTLRFEDHGYKICEGRSITVVTGLGNTYTYTHVDHDIITPYDTLKSATECDRLVCLLIEMSPYIKEQYTVSSCDSLFWGKDELGEDIVYRESETVERKFLSGSLDPCCDCDTIRELVITIVDTAKLEIGDYQDEFCKGEMGGEIKLNTNFTAFDWIYIDKKDTTLAVKEKIFEIEFPGFYSVWAYMDTSLYDTLKDLRIFNHCAKGIDGLLVAECPLIIPDIITPNGDGKNDVFGIKKLNPDRDNELTIYDRWGKIVFQQKNYKCVFKKDVYENIKDAFSGISRGGQKLPEGTYTYAFKYDSRPKSKLYKGVLVIMR